MTHLGELVCALIDGEVGGDAYDHAIVHMGECAQCRRDVAEQRWVKSQLAQLQPVAVPEADVFARLLAIPDVERAAADSPSARQLPVARSGRSRRLLRRAAPSRPLRTGQPAGRRPRTRTVAAAGFAATVVVGFSGAISGSAALSTGVGASGSAPSAFSAAALGSPISAVVPRPNARVAVSVVYRRP